jgi:hypothetical protein
MANQEARRRWDLRADTLVRELERLEGRITSRWDRDLSLQIDRVNVELDEYGYFDTRDKMPGVEDDQ